MGNEKACNLVDLLTGLSLHQLFCDAFEIQFEAKHRQEFLKARQEGKLTRRTWTDAVQDWLTQYGDLLSENEKKFIWIHVSEAVNKGVFNRTSQRLRSDWKLPPSANIRDHLTAPELKLVEQIEDTSMRILDKHGSQIKPLEAVHLAIEGLYIPTQTR